ncbi:MAG: co-chaperone GroES [Selenomonadaceae bacterium]|nr:co-chaperone GroES [Selenomonadaceae bacterium]
MIKPLGDRVVVEVAEVELKTKSGIIMPETSKEKPQKGKVVAVGTGKLLDNGTRAAMEVKVDDEVIFNKYAGSEVKVDDKDYLVIRESDILAIL